MDPSEAPHDVPSPENSDDAVQRLLNDAKRAEIEERYGAKFFSPKHSRIPPEIEGEWLAHVEEMERRMENAEQVPLRQFVELPFARALADLPAEAVEEELETLLDHFAKREVYVDFPDEVEAPEAYRFIVEELLDEPVLDFRMPGTRMHFVYGDRA
ncbi:MAG TPA: hypothetical protein VHO02_07570 [Fibrobacteria bacterium]|jgi:hypothetical protein|nr:hypothetical protein [Fibrobacteria bacterium]